MYKNSFARLACGEERFPPPLHAEEIHYKEFVVLPLSMIHTYEEFTRLARD